MTLAWAALSLFAQDAEAASFLRSHLDKVQLNSGSPFGHATCALVGLALLSTGAAPDDPNVQKAAKVVADFVDKTYNDSEKDRFQSNWILGFGGLLYAEMAARGRRDEAMMKKIAELLQTHQTKDGGWGHQKAPTTLIRGYPDTFYAPTNWCAAALGALRGQGIEVNSSAIERAVKLFETGQRPDGSFPYQAGQSTGEAGRTGAAIFALAMMDARTSPAYAKAVEYLKSHMAEVSDGHSSPAMHVMSAGLAAAAAGDWSSFIDTLGKQVKAARGPDGRLEPVIGEKTKKQEERRKEREKDRPKPPGRGGQEEAGSGGKEDPVLITAYHLIGLNAKNLRIFGGRGGAASKSAGFGKKK